MAVDPAGDIVRREIAALCERQGFDVTITAALNKNSEDLTPVDWGTLIAAVETMLEDGITRIVITHGTDTLSYSAAALGLVFQDAPARICLTGSFYALDTENSDGPLNLMAAFHAVTSDDVPTGVYVAFRGDRDNTYALIFAALDLKPMAFDGVAFDSVAGRRLATYTPGDGVSVLSISSNAPPALPSVPAQSLIREALSVAARQVLSVELYPGLAFDRIDHTRLSLLLVGLYHSGTGHALTGQGSMLSFMEHVDNKPQVLAATFPSTEITVPYESTTKLIDAGVNVTKDIPLHVIYVFAVLQLASGHTAEEIVRILQPWLMTKQSSNAAT